ncbi:hypothetical protein IDT60_21800 (plasmid) [Pseudarthrobacter sp. BIM B-2242]|nr:hypothetical protein IDT60_21800 [Pseudarthrobacter sp. BIM B-2242]
MQPMSTATLTEAPVPTLSLADRLNAVLQNQGERTLGLLDRCDSCSQHAQAEFTFLLPQNDGTVTESEIMLCGFHTRAHVAAIMERNPVGVWIEPSILWKIKGVEVPKQEHAKSGDGLTDA